MKFELARSEFLRIWKLLCKNKIADFFPEKTEEDLRRYAWYHYKLNPFHNFATHVGAGILYIMNEAQKHPENNIYEDLLRAYFTHDALHTGDSKKSPEIISAFDAFKFFNTDKYVLPIIATRFPYEFDTNLELIKLLRKVDTLRPLAGLSYNLLGVPNDTKFIAMMWECFGLHIEMKLDLIEWIDKIYLNSFIPYVTEKLHNDYYGEGEKEKKCLLNKVRDNEKMLRHHLNTHEYKLLIIEELRAKNCTYPEFVKYCWELEVF